MKITSINFIDTANLPVREPRANAARLRYQVRWINPRSIERSRMFTDFNKAVNFLALFPYGRAAMFSNR